MFFIHKYCAGLFFYFGNPYRKYLVLFPETSRSRTCCRTSPPLHPHPCAGRATVSAAPLSHFYRWISSHFRSYCCCLCRRLSVCWWMWSSIATTRRRFVLGRCKQRILSGTTSTVLSMQTGRSLTPGEV